MKKNLLILFALLLTNSIFAKDFVTSFLRDCVEKERPVSNVNIGNSMLNRMAANTDDEQLKTTFRELKSIRIITTENKKDSKYYFDKAKELISEQFKDYNEVVSVNERRTKTSILLKKINEKTQEFILIALDDDSKLTIVAVLGNIDFDTISKLSNSFRESETEQEVSKEETKKSN